MSAFIARSLTASAISGRSARRQLSPLRLVAADPKSGRSFRFAICGYEGFHRSRTRTCLAEELMSQFLCPHEGGGRLPARLDSWSAATACSPTQVPLRSVVISFNQGVEWNAAIRRYISVIPVSGWAPCEPPSDRVVSSAIVAKVGAAERLSQPDALTINPRLHMAHYSGRLSLRHPTPRPTLHRAPRRRHSCRANSTICRAGFEDIPLASPPTPPVDRAP